MTRHRPDFPHVPSWLLAFLFVCTIVGSLLNPSADELLLNVLSEYLSASTLGLVLGYNVLMKLLEILDKKVSKDD